VSRARPFESSMVAATFEEERCPALPARSTSRDLEMTGAAGPVERGGSMKVLVLALVSGIVLVGGGVGVAFHHGFLAVVEGGVAIGTSSSGTTPRPSAMEASHASRHVEFLKELPRASEEALSDAGRPPTVAPERSEAVLERTHKANRQVFTNASHEASTEALAELLATTVAGGGLPAANGEAKVQHNVTKATSSTSLGEQNGTASGGRNGTHNKTANITGDNRTRATHNKTANITGDNTTRANQTQHHHKHKKCKGGTLAACQCIFACKVFGAQPSQCSGEKAELLDTLVQKALTSPTNACRGMQCIVRCAKSLHCYDERLQQDCVALHNRSEAAGVEDETCSYECHQDDDDVVLSQ